MGLHVSGSTAAQPGAGRYQRRLRAIRCAELYLPVVWLGTLLIAVPASWSLAASVALAGLGSLGIKAGFSGLRHTVARGRPAASTSAWNWRACGAAVGPLSPALACASAPFLGLVVFLAAMIATAAVSPNRRPRRGARPVASSELPDATRRLSAALPHVTLYRIADANSPHKAFATAGGRIYLADSLFNQPDDILDAVAAHELAHHAGDGIRPIQLAQWLAVVTALAGGIALAVVLGPLDTLGFQTHDQAGTFLAVAFGFVFCLAALQPFVLAHSRRIERRTDELAARMLGGAAGYARWLELRIAETGHTEPEPRWYHVLTSRHPPVGETLAWARAYLPHDPVQCEPPGPPRPVPWWRRRITVASTAAAALTIGVAVALAATAGPQRDAQAGPGWTIHFVAAGVGFPLWVPAHLPAGWRLQGGGYSLTTSSGPATASLTYVSPTHTDVQIEESTGTWPGLYQCMYVRRIVIGGRVWTQCDPLGSPPQLVSRFPGAHGQVWVELDGPVSLSRILAVRFVRG